MSEPRPSEPRPSEPRPSEPRPSEPRPSEPRPSEPRRRVLLAEDNPLNQRVATVMLEQLGCDVDVVVDGAEAVKAATVTKYSAIFMDCRIPVLDGYQATAAIRLHSVASRRAPIVAVTASGADADRQRCLDAGMDDFLAKPLSLKSLSAVLDRWTPGRASTARGNEVTNVVSATRAGGDEPPVLDAQVVERLERLGDAAGQDLFGQLAVLFLADADSWLDSLGTAVARADISGIGNAAHTLGGASVNLGATELVRLCARLSETDALAAPGGLSVARTLLGAVEAELTRVRAVLSTPMFTS